MTAPEKGRWYWFKNWLHYHWLYLIIAAVALWIGISWLGNALHWGETLPDYQIAYVGKNSLPEDVQVIGYDGLRAFGDQDYYCSTIIQPVEAMAETCVDLVLQDSHANTPSLLCLPVRYAYGGTTKA